MFFNTDFDSTYFCSRSCPFRVLLHTPALFCPFERFTSCSRYFVCPLLSLSLLLDPKFPHKFRWCFVVSLSGRPLCLCPHPKPFTGRRRRRRRDENIVVVFVLFSRASDRDKKSVTTPPKKRLFCCVERSNSASSSSSSSSSSSKINRKSSWLTSQS